MIPRLSIGLGLVLLAFCNPAAFGQTAIPTGTIQDALRSDSKDRQQAAIVYLAEGAINTVDAGAIRGDLQNLFERSPDPEEKGAVLRLLGQIPTTGASIARYLKPYLSSRSVAIRRGAADAVGFAMKKLIPADVKMIAPTPGVAQFLGGAGWLELNESFAVVEDAAQQLLELVDIALKDSDSAVRFSAADSIHHVSLMIANSLPHPASVRDMEKVVNIDDNRRIWIDLLPTMERLNAVVPDLKYGMLDPSPATRRSAVLAASGVSNAKRLALATRTYQLETYEGKMPEPENPFYTGIRSILPYLINRLKDPSPNVRLTTMEAVEFLETDALAEVDSVSQAARDPDVFVRWVAARSLGKMIPRSPLTEPGEKAILALGTMLSDEDMDVRKAALTSLALNGTRARGALDAILVSASAGTDIEVRLQALRTLELLKGDSTKVVPVLILVLGDDDVRIRREAAIDLGHLGSAAKSATPALKQAMRDLDKEVRKSAAQSTLLIQQGR